MNITDILKENEEEFEKKIRAILKSSKDANKIIFLKDGTPVPKGNDYEDSLYNLGLIENEDKIKQFLKDSQLRLISAFKEMVEEMEKLPYKAQICQNRNGLDYCGTCEQAWEDCSCSARNTGYNKALDDLLSSLTEDK